MASCSFGKISTMVDWAVEISAAPPAPCTSRQNMISPRLLEKPHIRRAMLKMRMDPIK